MKIFGFYITKVDYESFYRRSDMRALNLSLELSKYKRPRDKNGRFIKNKSIDTWCKFKRISG